MSARVPVGSWEGGAYRWPCPICDCMLESKEAPSLERAACNGCRALASMGDTVAAIRIVIRERDDLRARTQRAEQQLVEAEARILDLLAQVATRGAA